MMGGMMGGGMDWGWGWMFSSGLMMLLFWGGIIALVALAVRGLSCGGASRSEARPTPLEIAQARYARVKSTATNMKRCGVICKRRDPSCGGLQTIKEDNPRSGVFCGR